MPQTFSTRLCLGAILLSGLLLRLHQLTGVSYWFDESFCLKMVEFPVLEMLQRTLEDPHPPFYYLLLKLWIALFGDSLLVPRLLSVLCGVLAIVGVFLCVREGFRLGGHEVRDEESIFASLLAATFVALSPAHIEWSQQVRMYSLGTALAAWSSFLLLRALHRAVSGWNWNWTFYTGIAIALAYTHYFGLFTVIAQYLFALGWLSRQHRSHAPAHSGTSFTAVLISAACVYFAWSPWLIPFFDHRQLVAEKFPTRPFSWSVMGTVLCRTFDLQLVTSVSPETGFFVAQACFLGLILLLISGRPLEWFLGVVASLPFIVAGITSLFMRTIFVHRYLLMAQMFWLVSLAVLVGRIPFVSVRRGIGVLLVALLGWITIEHYQVREFNAALPGMRGAVAYLDETRQPTEPVVVCNPMLFTSIVAYTQHHDRIYATGSPLQYPFYQGTAVMRDDEYLSAEELNRTPSQKVWTFDADKWFNHTWSVRMPPGWKEVSRRRFTEFNAEFIVRCYVRAERLQVPRVSE